MVVGRTDQVAILREGIGKVLSGESGPTTFFVTGEAGIGKSTILRALDEKLRSSPNPPTVVFAECSTPLAGHDIGEVEALAPWIDLVEALTAEQNEKQFRGRSLAGKLALAWMRCIPVVGDVLESAADTALIVKKEKERKEKKSGDASPSQGALSQEQMFRQCINLIAAVAERQPLVIMLDDMHWADTSSTNLLFAAARELVGRPVAFVVAYRPDEALASRGGEGHPVVRVQSELERYSLAQNVDVPFLDSVQVRSLLRALHDNYQDQPEFEEWLLRISSGNALFITQFLNTLKEDGTIDPVSGTVRGDFRTVQVPESAQSVVTERIRRLDDESRELLRYASVEGETFSALLLRHVTEENRLTILRRLRQIEEKHGIITSLGKQRAYSTETTLYRFSHALLHDAMYNGLAEEEREAIHELILDFLLQKEEEADDQEWVAREISPRIATHAAVLGRYKLATRQALKASGASWREMAIDETVRLVELALEYIERARQTKRFDTDLTTLESEAYRKLGLLHRHRGEYEEAYDDTLRAYDLAQESKDDETRVGITCEVANSLRYLGRFDEAQQYAEQALGLAEEIGFERGIAGALNALGTILYSVERKDQAAEKYLRAIDIQEELGEIEGQASTLSNLGNAFLAMDQTDEAIRCYERSLDLAAEADNMVGYGAALLHLGNVTLRQEKYDEACGYYDQSRAIGQRIAHRELESRSIINMGVARRDDGDLAGARSCFDEAEEMIREWAPDIFRAEVMVEVAMLDWKELADLSDPERGILTNQLIERLEEARSLCGDLTGYPRTKIDELLDEVKDPDTAR
jgi:predicted ATPase